MQRLAGRWAGTYEYEQPDVPGSRQVSFSLELFDSSSWRLNGEVWDDPVTGAEAKGVVLGWSWRRHVWFKKIMPSLHVAHHPKPMALEDWVEANYNDRVAGDPGVHVIWYRGIIARDEEYLEGTWQLPHCRFVLESKGVIVFPSACGTWHMRRH